MQNTTRTPLRIAVPRTLDAWYRERLSGLQDVVLVSQDDHPFIDVGGSTLIHVAIARSLFTGLNDRSLTDTLLHLDRLCDCPVLLIDGVPFPRQEGHVKRSLLGFIAYLGLFTRIRAIQVPNSEGVADMIRVMAKQTQVGFNKLGLEDLEGNEDA